MLKIDHGPDLVRWPLIEDEDWCTLHDIDFMKVLHHAFRYVHGTRMVVLNSGAGLTAGILAANFPAARVSASDEVCWSSSTFQMADVNGLDNIDFIRKFGFDDVALEDRYDCALVLSTVNDGPAVGDLVGAAARAVRPGGRVILVAAETGGNGRRDSLPEGEIQQRIDRTGLAVLHQSRVSGFSVYIGLKAGPCLP